MALKKTTKKPAFRFPKTFTATVTQSIYDSSLKNRSTNRRWYLMSDCPVALAVRRALKVKRHLVSASRVDCSVVSPTGKRRNYTHDGFDVVRAFDDKGVETLTLPKLVTFKLAPKDTL